MPNNQSHFTMRESSINDAVIPLKIYETNENTRLMLNSE